MLYTVPAVFYSRKCHGISSISRACPRNYSFAAAALSFCAAKPDSMTLRISVADSSRYCLSCCTPIGGRFIEVMVQRRLRLLTA